MASMHAGSPFAHARMASHPISQHMPKPHGFLPMHKAHMQPDPAAPDRRPRRRYSTPFQLAHARQHPRPLEPLVPTSFSCLHPTNLGSTQQTRDLQQPSSPASATSRPALHASSQHHQYGLPSHASALAFQTSENPHAQRFIAARAGMPSTPWQLHQGCTTHHPLRAPMLQLLKPCGLAVVMQKRHSIELAMNNQ